MPRFNYNSEGTLVEHEIICASGTEQSLEHDCWNDLELRTAASTAEATISTALYTVSGFDARNSGYNIVTFVGGETGNTFYATYKSKGDYVKADHLNAKENELNADQKRKITISTATATGGANGDVWLQYEDD